MASFNKVILMGNLTRDPEMSFTPTQTAVVDFGMAMNKTWTGKDGQKKEEVCFVDCVIFGKRGEAVNKYFKKGEPIMIEGRLSFESWAAQDGSKRSKLKVVADSFEFVGGQQKAAQEPQQKDRPATGPDYDPNNPDDIPF